MSYKKVTTNFGYDKHMEHVDQTPLGKLQQQYWTTKQQVIKKLGKKEDEYVVMSDAELDAKLDLFEAIDQNSADLLRVIEMYQDKLIVLSIEEGEMSRFLKSHSTYDTKTKAGKMMAAVAKAQNFASQQRTSLRLPLVRLYNEVETFRNRAIADTFLTIRNMEIARTEYRGALLWMKNVSNELDPDTGKKLEKFRRVQAQVKKTKTKFDRLKGDVIQKIELLAASRCNMFSHVLVSYSKILLMFWEKTAKTMNAVAEAFKGYQYYEFNIIKDLVEPSKKLADLVNSSGLDKKTGEEGAKEASNDDQLIGLSEEHAKENTLIDLEEDDAKLNENINEVNKLIDLMTLNEANNLNEQLKELEQIEMEKRHKNGVENIKNTSKGAQLASSLFGLTTQANNNSQATATSLTLMSSGFNLNSFTEILNNAGNEFEREWEAAFTNQVENATTSVANTATDFNFFSSNNTTDENTATLFADLLNNNEQLKLDLNLIETSNKPTTSLLNSTNNISTSGLSEKQTQSKNNAWYDLFAELDPIKNPDTIGKETEKDERNC